MKRMNVVIVVLAVVLLFPAIVFAVPEMSFDTINHDFGSVTAGEQLHYAFEFSNTGDEDLQITRLKPSWGVTALRAGQGPIKPGESDIVDVYIDTAGKRGSFAKTVTINTNDPAKPSVVLQLRATVMAPAESPQSRSN